jgi:flagellar basal-body rod protein FlgB
MVDKITLLEAGLKAASLKESVIANNIANIDTPGFRRGDVRFQNLLAAALEHGGAGVSEIEPEIVQPMTTPVSENGNDTSMDLEVGELIKNSGQYKVYMRLMNKLYQQLGQAISGT